MADNRSSGIESLVTYFDNSVLSKAPYYPITNIDGLISYLDTTDANFIANLGSVALAMTPSSVQSSMANLAQGHTALYPTPNELMIAISQATPSDSSNMPSVIIPSPTPSVAPGTTTTTTTTSNLSIFGVTINKYVIAAIGASIIALWYFNSRKSKKSSSLSGASYQANPSKAMLASKHLKSQKNILLGKIKRLNGQIKRIESKYGDC